MTAPANASAAFGAGNGRPREHVAKTLSSVIAALVVGVGIEPLPAAPRVPEKRDWQRYYRLPQFLQSVIRLLQAEAASPSRLASLYLLGIHRRGYIKQDDHQFDPRRRRRRKTHWVTLLRSIAGLVAMMDIRSRYVATPRAGEMLVRDWPEIFRSTHGEFVPHVLGLSRLDRATKLLRKLGYIDVHRIHVTEDQGDTFKARPAFKRVTLKLFEALGVAEQYRATRNAMLDQGRAQAEKDAKKAAKAKRSTQAEPDRIRNGGTSRPLSVAAIIAGVGSTTSPASPRDVAGRPPPVTGPPVVLERPPALKDGASVDDQIEYLKTLLKD